MSGAPRVRSMNIDEAEVEAEARPVLVPAGNKARVGPTARKPASKPARKPPERLEFGGAEAKKKAPKNPNESVSPVISPLSAPPVSGKHELLLRPNLSMNASCSSDASTDSSCSRACSRASTGRIGKGGLMIRPRSSVVKRDKAVLLKEEKVVPDGVPVQSPELVEGKRKCAWVTPNTDPCYAAFHDEEWGIPVHDDKKLFELLVLSGALAELTWPAILSKRHTFRDVFMGFDPVEVAKLNEKKTVAPGSIASSLLSEPKLRAVIENACQILKITDEFGSFDRYCWSFVNHKSITSRFRYPRQVPVKTPKAEVISKDLVRRGFRSVGPTVIYSFMQAAGLTNDHLISCFRFEECAAEADGFKSNANAKIESKSMGKEEALISDLGLSRAVDMLNMS
ncbi:putative GMP synthase (glutamine-hydrolyzing) [Ananas comosus]|uniref:Putative GMP synthase (Glutamine-hydrolyzing) n=1 Tax=Ananas comosus TaxID=4615 RepID=A0A199VUD5_ANACO|nr:putative GMP synthase (glutamine-hydrolyzing) [Ananas comosus]